MASLIRFSPAFLRASTRKLWLSRPTGARCATDNNRWIKNLGVIAQIARSLLIVYRVRPALTSSVRLVATASGLHKSNLVCWISSAFDHAWPSYSGARGGRYSPLLYEVAGESRSGQRHLIGQDLHTGRRIFQSLVAALIGAVALVALFFGSLHGANAVHTIDSHTDIAEAASRRLFQLSSPPDPKPDRTWVKGEYLCKQLSCLGHYFAG